jgi:methionyl-tRNA synthetase
MKAAAGASRRAIWAWGNEYVQTTEPWSLFKTNPEPAAAIIHLSKKFIAQEMSLALFLVYAPDTNSRKRYQYQFTNLKLNCAVALAELVAIIKRIDLDLLQQS